MSIRPSYWLKVDRAAEHLKEIEDLVAPYDVPRPYAITHSVEGKTKDHVYRAYPAEEPDPWIAIVLGDFLFDLRSALDHLRVALVPPKRRWSGVFPILTEDIWKRDADGDYPKSSARERQVWESAVQGMSEGAIRKLHEIQPFRFGDTLGPHMSLAILNRLNNADKHRNLVAVANFLRPTSVTIHWDEGPEHFDVPPTSRYRGGGHGAVIARLDREVEVEASGAIQVTIGAGPHARGGYGLPEGADQMWAGIAGAIIPAFEPFVRR